jgi:hypothetical protein
MNHDNQYFSPVAYQQKRKKKEEEEEEEEEKKLFPVRGCGSQ